MNRYSTLPLLLLLLLTWPLTAHAIVADESCEPTECLGGLAQEKTGFLLAAPDRGYAGNQRVRQAFSKFDSKYNAQLVFVTDERMEPYLKKALQALEKNDMETLVVLPLFYSMSHPRLVFLRKMLARVIPGDREIILARSFGNTYLAVEMLTERLKQTEFDAQNPLLVIGHGASTERSFKLMERDLRRIATMALKDFEEKEIEVVILPGDGHGKNSADMNNKVMASISELGAKRGIENVLPYHLGPNLDSMMSVNAWIAGAFPRYMKLVEPAPDEIEFFSLWMHREANRYLSATGAPLGLLFHAHGAYFHWNQGMREAVEELTHKYPVEFAFSMADPEDLRSAVQRLEQRGVGVIVIVRVFGMRASFRHAIERLIGLDVDAPELCKTEEEGDLHEGEPPMRLRTNALVVTEGGLGDSGYFAAAMLDRANQLAVDKPNDTVILVAHGKGTESANQQWLNVLASLVNKMKTMSGNAFRDIKYQTWQEDWADNRDARIGLVREMVQEANRNGGHAIVIPARTTGKGRSRQFLKGEQFIAGEGFAPHPLFLKWVEQQLARGAQTVGQTRHVWYPALPVTGSDK